MDEILKTQMSETDSHVMPANQGLHLIVLHMKLNTKDLMLAL